MEWKLWVSQKEENIRILQLLFLNNDGMKPFIVLKLEQKVNSLVLETKSSLDCCKFRGLVNKIKKYKKYATIPCFNTTSY